MSKVSSLTHFPLEPGCEDYSFLDKAKVDFEQGLDSILSDPVETLELDASLFPEYWGELWPNSPTYATLPNLLYTAELCT